MRGLLIAGLIALCGAMNTLTSDSTMQETKVSPETTKNRQGSDSNDPVKPGLFNASVAELPKNLTEATPSYTEGLPITATVGERQCEGTWCSSRVEVGAEAFATWEGLCSDELLSYHYGCPVEVTFTLGGIAHQASVFLKPGERPTVEWASYGAPDGSRGVFAIASTPL